MDAGYQSNRLYLITFISPVTSGWVIHELTPYLVIFTECGPYLIKVRTKRNKTCIG